MTEAAEEDISGWVKLQSGRSRGYKPVALNGSRKMYSDYSYLGSYLYGSRSSRGDREFSNPGFRIAIIFRCLESEDRDEMV